ncbi:MAG: heavy-metal-associated domain-containing protein [Sphingomonadaceae bacterium]
MAAETREGSSTAPTNGSDEPVELVMPVRGLTCQARVRRTRAALESVPGVVDARVELVPGMAVLRIDPARVTAGLLQDAVAAAGYHPGEPEPAPGAPAAEQQERSPTGLGLRDFLGRPAMYGAAGSALLVALYLGLVTLAQGFEHAAELLSQDWYFVLAIALGFGVQLDLFFYMRRALHKKKGTGSAAAVAGASTGTSSVAMLACCAHHVADVLPFVGLSGAALLLSEYRQPLMLVGVASNLAGIAVMVRTIRERPSTCTS